MLWMDKGRDTSYPNQFARRVRRAGAQLQVEPHFLNVGLCHDGEGQIHVGAYSRQWIVDMQNGKTSQEAREAGIFNEKFGGVTEMKFKMLYVNEIV